MDQEKKVILLSGPTASGKSKLAIKLAKYFDGEIINADSMQIYKEISILNSKPNLNDRKIVKHHLYGFKSVKENFSTGHWLKEVVKKIKKQWKTKKTPIIVGGTGLYFKSLTNGLVKIPNIPIALRNEIRQLHEKLGQQNFFNLLCKMDPLSKKFLIPSDSQRSMRAYEVKKFTNKSLFEFMKETKLSFDDKIFKKFFINTPRNLLNTKIEKRVEQMFKNGAVKEVKFFLKLKINNNLSANNIIGIKEIRDYLDKNISLLETKSLIKQRTRQYGKRQFTWARGHMKSWEMIYSSNINDLFKKIVNKIS